MNGLNELYACERERLLSLAEADSPQGEYDKPVFGCGCPAPRLLLIGEAPGAEETKLSQPFVGKAGRQLNELLTFMQLTRDEIYITNTVKYRPVVRSERSVRNRTPLPREVLLSLPLLRAEILRIRPSMAATLGNTSLNAVLALAGMQKSTVGELHGHAVSAVIEGFRFILFPLYHPASGIYNRDLIPVMEHDARLVGEHLVKKT